MWFAASELKVFGLMARRQSIQPAMQSINNPVVAVLMARITGYQTGSYSFSPAELGVFWYCHEIRR
jgi:hypothetical protein